MISQELFNLLFIERLDWILVREDFKHLDVDGVSLFVVADLFLCSYNDYAGISSHVLDLNVIRVCLGCLVVDPTLDLRQTV